VLGTTIRLSLLRIVLRSSSDAGLRTPFVAVIHIPTLPYSGFIPPRVVIAAPPVHVVIPTRSTCAPTKSVGLEL
jgi:hypothetical protein